MKDVPSVDPYRPPMSAELRRPVESAAAQIPRSFVMRALAFLLSPRIAMRAVLDTASLGTAFPLAAVWGIVQFTSNSAPVMVRDFRWGDGPVLAVVLLVGGAIFGNLSWLYFSTLAWLTGLLFVGRVRFRSVCLVVAWSALPQIVLLPVAAIYYALEAGGAFASSGSDVGAMLLGALAGFLSMALAVCSVVICVIGLSELSGRSIARCAGWFAVAALVGSLFLAVVVQVILRALS